MSNMKLLCPNCYLSFNGHFPSSGYFTNEEKSSIGKDFHNENGTLHVNEKVTIEREEGQIES